MSHRPSPGTASPARCTQPARHPRRHARRPRPGAAHARTRPLVVAGRYDRAAIMAAACKAATGSRSAVASSPRRGHVFRAQGHVAGGQSRSPRRRSLKGRSMP